MFLVMRQVMRVAGFGGARRIGRVLADVQFRVAWRERRRCLEDLAQLLARPARDPWVRAQLREAYRVNTVAALEALAMFDRGVDRRVLDARCEVEGLANLQGALSAGRGAILMAAHMGNGALLATRLAGSGMPVSVLYNQGRMLSADFLRRGLALYGIDGIMANEGIRAYARMLDALRRGRILFVMLDQGTKASQPGVTLRFLGKDMRISAGPAQLARHSGAPVLPVSTTAAEPVWRFAIGTALPLAAGATLESDVERLARTTEKQILEHPHLWSWHHRRWRNFPMAQ
jgi:KDO2-lipid IV(A) lauroyltransferase